MRNQNKLPQDSICHSSFTNLLLQQLRFLQHLLFRASPSQASPLHQITLVVSYPFILKPQRLCIFSCISGLLLETFFNEVT